MGLWALLMGGGLITWWWHYRHRAVHTPKLVHQDNAFHQRLIHNIPRLTRKYTPTPWAYNTHAQLIWLVFSSTVFKRQLPMQRQLLTMKDGGTTAVDWLDTDQPPDSPILVVLHTIGGSRQSMTALMKDLHELTGWRLALCLRRGHDTLPFTAARYNTMGDMDDFHEQLAHIKSRYPNAPLYGVGSSAGSALLVRYLGETQDNSALAAGIAYCPAYDTEVAFERLHPFYSRKIARDLVREFIAPHTAYFAQLPNFERACQAKNLAQLQSYMHEFSGYATPTAYHQQCNPATVMSDIKVPLLVINADDDPVCVKQNVLEHQDKILSMDKTLLVRTQRGSHCAFYEGWRANSWANQLMAEYLQTIDKDTASFS